LADHSASGKATEDRTHESEDRTHESSEGAVVVVPAYNEARGIGEVVARVRDRFARVVVVDDGSSDDTAQIARAAGAEVIRHPVNLGQGAALQTGIRWALQTGARWIVTFDADGQHDPDDALRLLRQARERGLDVCFGSRFLGSTEGMPKSRRLLLRLALLFQRVTTGMKLSDVHNGLRALSRDAAGRIDLRQNRMAHASELVAQVAALGLKFGEAPVTIRYSEYSLAKGQSSLGAVQILFDLLLARLGR
jgi:glycosyltransferase involved in cell wall biosynthesis